MSALKTKIALLEHLESNPLDSLRWSCGGGSVSAAGYWTIGNGTTTCTVDGRAANAIVKAGVVRQVGIADSRFSEYKARPFLLKSELEEMRRLSSKPKPSFSL